MSSPGYGYKSMTLRERLEAAREAFDGWLDQVAHRLEPAGEWLTKRRTAIDAWFGRERSGTGRLGVVVLRPLYSLAKSALLLVVFGFVFLFVMPIAIVGVLAVIAVVFSPLILIYVLGWLLLGWVGVEDDNVRLLVLGVLTFVTIRIVRRMLANPGGSARAD